MYDIIKCKMYIPEDPKVLFQTRSLKCLMYYYTIREDGRLICHNVIHNIVPEEERPYFNTQEWYKLEKARAVGSLAQQHINNTMVEYEGPLVFYVLLKKNYIEYTAEFKNSVCQEITRVNRKIIPPWGLKGGEHLNTNQYV